MESLKQKLHKTPLKSHWARIGIHPHRGVSLPLGSLHSKNSCGIGEFFDLIHLIKWCSELKLDTIQLLPLNDSGSDPSPYNALSSCALHPIYLSLSELPKSRHKKLLPKIEALRKLNQTKRVPFQEVLEKKMEFLTLYFKLFGQEVFASEGFTTFVQGNVWIRPYALYKVLKEKSNYTPFCLWQDDWKNISDTKFESLFQENIAECSFYIALQYLCFSQLKQVKQIAEEFKILLKGDIPILISPDSSDVWYHPELFDLSLSVGAPPDQFNQEGQYWGFPVPKWDIMREDGFLWWKNRLLYANSFYDLYRIDHAIGLFCLWTVPVGRPVSEGSYLPKSENHWEPLGKELLETFIETSSMLPIAEDLGLVAPRIRPVLDKMGICGTKVMRWEKDEDGSFSSPKYYHPLSLTCISTHDSSTLSGWWIEEPEEAASYAKQKKWSYKHPLSLPYRKHILKDSLRSKSLFHINLLSEYLALVPDLVDPDPEEERINIPGTILPSNWTYKFRYPVEEIVSHPELKQEMAKLLVTKKPNASS